MSDLAPNLPAAETVGPKEIGTQMARLREQFQLSQQEVSERLHIRSRYVNAIEEGRYELMPGKVYARGYVHTYAEFLGLNPEQVVAQCFAGELPSNAQPIPPIAAARHTSPQARMHSISSTRTGQWRSYAVLGAIVLVIALVVSQFVGHGSEAPGQTATTVAPVPEAMLASVRTLVMPLPNNYECLTSNALFACSRADAASTVLNHLDAERYWYGGKLDPADVAQQSASAEDDPDSLDAAVTPNTSLPSADEDDDQVNEMGPPHD